MFGRLVRHRSFQKSRLFTPVSQLAFRTSYRPSLFSTNSKQEGGEEQEQKQGFSFWRWYNECLASSPLLTKMITSGVIGAVGDVVCQSAIEKSDKLDWARVGRMTLVGTFLVGTHLHYWYGFLFTTFTRVGTAGAVQRMLIDQALFAPYFLGVFFTGLFTLEGHPEKTLPHLREHGLSALTTNYALWVPAQVVNFRFVPPQFQVLFANGVALIWNTYLAWNAHRGVDHEGDTPDLSSVGASTSD